MENVVFISSINSPKVLTSSTDIMTNVILDGLIDNDINVLFIALCERQEYKNDIIEFYNSKKCNVVVIDGFFSGTQSKYKYFYRLFRHSMFISKYKKKLSQVKILKSFIPNIIISHCGVYEATLFGRALKKLFKEALYYQYWSDPMTLSGITPDLIKKKLSRRVYYHFEKVALCNCDRVIFGTEPLKFFQSLIFPQLKNKFFYIDIPYVSSGNIDCIDYSTDAQTNNFLYAGNYYKKVRNIEPLLSAFKNNEIYNLDIYGEGDVCGFNSCNITFHRRILTNEMRRVESNARNIICLLNSNCIQIPGKIFYSINLKSRIFVIVDGKYSEIITRYLAKYKRFILCKNSEEDITEKLFSSTDQTIDFETIKRNYSPGKIASDLLCGGI